MANNSLRLLLIEDSPDDADLAKSQLAKEDIVLVEAGTLGSGLEMLASGEIDITLLDLNVPDSHGLETLVHYLKVVTTVPVVVWTGQSDEERAIKAVQMGAQDYLIKDELPPGLLVRSLRYARARWRLHCDLNGVRRKELEQREEEFRAQLEGLAQTESGANPSLRHSAPEQFAEFLERYKQILAHGKEMRTHKVEYAISPALQQLAEDLEALKAGPRDLIDIHVTVRDELTNGTSEQSALLIREEGYLLTVELMGFLLGLYRRYALGSSAGQSTGDRMS